MNKTHQVLFILLLNVIFISACTNADTSIVESTIEPTSEATSNPSTMLVLGSDDAEKRAGRVALACLLLENNPNLVENIIMSGGCGAHGEATNVCEATLMEELIKQICPDAIRGINIYQEIKSQNTKQNYCFSRDKTTNGGNIIIQPGDTLYVVSSHYHALSVSACFENDGVDAHYYYICGTTTPTVYEGTPPPLATVATSQVTCWQDYTGIASSCATPNWCSTVEATSTPNE